MRLYPIATGLMLLTTIGCASTPTQKSRLDWRLLEPHQYPPDTRTACALICHVEQSAGDAEVDAQFRYVAAFEEHNLRVVVIDSAVCFLEDSTGIELNRHSAVSEILLEPESDAYVGNWTVKVRPSHVDKMRWRIYLGTMKAFGNQITSYVHEFAYPSRSR